jgi:hypothetical protein
MMRSVLVAAIATGAVQPEAGLIVPKRELYVPSSPAIVRAENLEFSRHILLGMPFTLGMLPGKSKKSLSLYAAIVNLGIATNLRLCLDAGDANSYNPSVQTTKWLDVSGNGNDFFRGSSTSGDAAEPTFNGTAGGLSGSEYWSYDGGDYFVHDAANTTWMENIHKDSATYTIFAVGYIVSTSTSYVISATRSGSGAGFTASFVRGSTGRPLLFVANASNGTVLLRDSTLSHTVSSWAGVGISVNESAGTGVFTLNSSSETFSSTYTSPSTGNAAGTMTVGSEAGLTLLAPSGSRLSCLAVWEGTALSASNLTSLYAEISKRY